MNRYFPALTLDSTLSDLPSSNVTIASTIHGIHVYDRFINERYLPGVIISKLNRPIGIISRNVFFEKTSRQFGTEVFFNRPIEHMINQLIIKPLVLRQDCSISQAVKHILTREFENIYEPVVILMKNNTLRIIASQTVFVAENQILLMLHNHDLQTSIQRIPLSDQQTLQYFSSYSKLPPGFDTTPFFETHNISCDLCGKPVHYSIADVVRSHPQLSRGIEIIDRMGSRTYTLYIRHICQNQIREIPVHHDDKLAFRSVRPSRLVSTYV
jgi:hypothetical protein